MKIKLMIYFTAVNVSLFKKKQLNIPLTCQFVYKFMYLVDKRRQVKNYLPIYKSFRYYFFSAAYKNYWFYKYVSIYELRKFK